jgi:hypothetical protein
MTTKREEMLDQIAGYEREIEGLESLTILSNEQRSRHTELMTLIELEVEKINSLPGQFLFVLSDAWQGADLQVKESSNDGNTVFQALHKWLRNARKTGATVESVWGRRFRITWPEGTVVYAWIDTGE